LKESLWSSQMPPHGLKSTKTSPQPRRTPVQVFQWWLQVGPERPAGLAKAGGLPLGSAVGIPHLTKARSAVHA